MRLTLPNLKRQAPCLAAMFLPLSAVARTQMAMPEREHVQTIVWIMEATTFTTIVVVFVLIWRFVKRDQARRKAAQHATDVAQDR